MIQSISLSKGVYQNEYSLDFQEVLVQLQGKLKLKVLDTVFVRSKKFLSWVYTNSEFKIQINQIRNWQLSDVIQAFIQNLGASSGGIQNYGPPKERMPQSELQEVLADSWLNRMKICIATDKKCQRRFLDLRLLAHPDIFLSQNLTSLQLYCVPGRIFLQLLYRHHIVCSPQGPHQIDEIEMVLNRGLTQQGVSLNQRMAQRFSTTIIGEIREKSKQIVSSLQSVTEMKLEYLIEVNFDSKDQSSGTVDLWLLNVPQCRILKLKGELPSNVAPKTLEKSKSFDQRKTPKFKQIFSHAALTPIQDEFDTVVTSIDYESVMQNQQQQISRWVNSAHTDVDPYGKSSADPTTSAASKERFIVQQPKQVFLALPTAIRSQKCIVRQKSAGPTSLTLGFDNQKKRPCSGQPKLVFCNQTKAKVVAPNRVQSAALGLRRLYNPTSLQAKSTKDFDIPLYVSKNKCARQAIFDQTKKNSSGVCSRKELVQFVQPNAKALTQKPESSKTLPTHCKFLKEAKALQAFHLVLGVKSTTRFETRNTYCSVESDHAFVGEQSTTYDSQPSMRRNSADLNKTVDIAHTSLGDQTSSKRRSVNVEQRCSKKDAAQQGLSRAYGQARVKSGVRTISVKGQSCNLPHTSEASSHLGLVPVKRDSPASLRGQPCALMLFCKDQKIALPATDSKYAYQRIRSENLYQIKLMMQCPERRQLFCLKSRERPETRDFHLSSLSVNTQNMNSQDPSPAAYAQLLNEKKGLAASESRKLRLQTPLIKADPPVKEDTFCSLCLRCYQVASLILKNQF